MVSETHTRCRSTRHPELNSVGTSVASWIFVREVRGMMVEPNSTPHCLQPNSGDGSFTSEKGFKSVYTFSNLLYMRTTYFRVYLVAVLPLPFRALFRVRGRLVSRVDKSSSASVSTSSFGRFEGVFGITGMFSLTSDSLSTVAWEDGATDEDGATGEDRGSRRSLQKVSANNQRVNNKLVNLQFASTGTSCTGR